MTTLGTLPGSKRYLLASAPAARARLAAFVAMGAVAVAYFLSARLGLALLSAHSEVAVFWPASGIAVGILVVFGRRLLPGLVIGVVVGTIAANLLSDRSLWTSIFKGFCNAGEAVLTAWLLERWFGRPFTFDDLRRIAGFLAAAGLAAAASAVGGAATMTLLHTNTTAPFWDVWRTLLLSDGVGIVVVAPVVIGLGQVWREPPSRREWVEGVGVLALLALAGFYAISQPSESWLSFNPGIVVLPSLLWLAARCPPVFAIAGAFAASMMVICATIYGIGRFGDIAVPIIERVKGAQAVTGTGTIFTLVLLALFIQRKNAEEGLRESEGSLVKERAMLTRLHEVGSRLWLKRDLHQALEEILAGAIELLGADTGIVRILDPTRSVLRIEAHRGIKQEFIDLFQEMPAAGATACARALRQGQRVVIADVERHTPAAPTHSLTRAVGFRAIQSTPIIGREATPLGVLSTHFRSAHAPDEQDLRLLDLYVRQAADIIERHKAEDALRKSEERLRLAQLKTGIGIWDWDLNTGRLTWTPELETLFGLEAGTVKCYEDFRERVHPDDIAAVEANRDEALRRRETFRSEFRIIRPDGQVRWILSTGGAFFDDVTGQPTRILGNNADISERKVAEENLQKSEQLFRDLLGALPAAIFVTDAAGHITYCNEGAINLWGARPKLGIDSWDDLARFYYPDGKRMELSDCPIEIALKQGRSMRGHEAILERTDGTRIPIIPYPMPLRDAAGAIVGVVNMTIDISGRKQAELALAERNAQLALAGRAARVGSYAYDVKKGRMQVSEGYAAIHGLPEGTNETSYDEWRTRVHPEDLGQAEGSRDQAFAERRKEDNAEYRIVLPSGEVRWIERRGSISYGEDGRPDRIVGVNIDVTERRRAEQHQRALNAELDHRVKNVLATVSAIVGQTQEASSSPADFAAGLDRRIRSLAGTHELLSRRNWRGVPLAEIVQRELAPYGTSHSDIGGPSVTLKAEATQAVAMVIHELTTNAAKYGAFSNRTGRVSVRWRWQQNGLPDRLIIEWREIDGPPVRTPNRPGYGTSIIRELIPFELGGSVELSFSPEGTKCRLDIPCEWASRTAEAVSVSEPVRAVSLD